MNVRDVVSRINWAKLRNQKDWLIFHDCPQAEGLIHLIDAIQDAAVNEGLATENEVFFS